MNKEQKNQIEEKLNDEVEDTKKKITKYKELSQPIAPENSIGRVSRMDAINNKSVVEAALREAEEKLLKLLDIQKKITQKNFGLCIKCKNEIPFGRLIFRPESQLCVYCAK
jgi:DnaK suppressor protein